MPTAAVASKIDSIQKVLNKQIANWGLLYIKFHNFHWYVKGHEFFSLHNKFQELYNEADLNLDQLAERLLAIDGKPLATMKEYMTESTLKEAKRTENTEQMMKGIVEDCEILITELDEGMKIAKDAEDEATADLLLQIHVSLEKHRWMFKSFLG